MKSVIPWESIHHYWWLWLILFLASVANLFFIRIKRIKELVRELKITDSGYELEEMDLSLELEYVWTGMNSLCILLLGLALAACVFNFHNG